MSMPRTLVFVIVTTSVLDLSWTGCFFVGQPNMSTDEKTANSAKKADLTACKTLEEYRLGWFDADFSRIQNGFGGRIRYQRKGRISS